MVGSFQPSVDYLLVLAGVVGYVVAMQLLVFAGDRSEHVHLWSAAWSFCALLFIMGRYVHLGTGDAAAALLGSRLQNASASLLAGLSVGAMSNAGARPRWAGAVPVSLALGLIFGYLALFTSLVEVNRYDVRVDILGRRYLEPRTTVVQTLEFGFIALAVGYCLWNARRSNFLADRERRRSFGLAAWLLAPLGANEILHAARVIDSVHVLEFGLTAAAVVMNHTVTQRYHRVSSVRAAITRAEQSFLKLVHGSQDGVLLERHGVVMLANAAASGLLGRGEPDELVGRAVGELLSASARGRESLPEITSSEPEAPRVGRIRRSDGSDVLVATVRLPVVFDGLPATVTMLRPLSEDEQVAERARFVEGVIAAQEDERRRIARELHDEAGQSLTSVLVGLRQIEELLPTEDGRARCHKLSQVAQTTLDDLGRLARGLHPQILDELGFTAAVERYAQQVGGLHGVPIDVEVVDQAENVLSKATASVLYRVIQEALNNAIRHGDANHVSLVVHRDATGVRITVDDDGCGFDTDQKAETSSAGGFGLRVMRERVALLGGSLEIDSAPGAGTTLVAQVPSQGEAVHG